MQLKDAHVILAQGDCFERRFTFSGNTVLQRYCFKPSIEGFRNFVVYADGCVYDYSKILTYDDLSCYKNSQQLNVLNDSVVAVHQLAALTSDELNKIILSNIAAASHVKELKERHKLLSLIAEL